MTALLLILHWIPISTPPSMEYNSAMPLNFMVWPMLILPGRRRRGARRSRRTTRRCVPPRTPPRLAPTPPTLRRSSSSQVYCLHYYHVKNLQITSQKDQMNIVVFIWSASCSDGEPITSGSRVPPPPHHPWRQSLPFLIEFVPFLLLQSLACQVYPNHRHTASAALPSGLVQVLR